MRDELIKTDPNDGPARRGSGSQPEETRDVLPEQAAARLVAILDDYMDQLKAGSAPSPAQLLAEHPELADQLEACLAGLEFIHAAGSPEPGPPLSLGDYRILREVGRGGMGAVYEAQQISLGRRVALKVLRFGAVSDPEAISRFQREAETVAQLHHTNIVPIFAVGRQRGIDFYAMQFIEGCSLAQLLQQQSTPPEPQQVAEWGLQAAEALEHAHRRQVIHRDVKPSNLLLDSDGRIWLTDFGLAKRLDDVTLSMTGALLGTPRYMSPEQASTDPRPIDHRTDIYSLGATLYELATGQPVFDGQTPQRVISQILSENVVPPGLVRPGLPRDLDTILLKCLNKDVELRYRSTRELADDLRAFLDGRPISARRPGMVDRTVKWFRRQRRSVALAAAAAAVTLLLVAAIGLGGAAWSRWQRSYLSLLTNHPPLVAELFDVRDRPATGPTTVPLQRPLALPSGSYRLQLSGAGRFSQSLQTALDRGRQNQLEVSLEDQMLWSSFSVDRTFLPVDFGTVHDLVLLDEQGLRRVRGADRQLQWTVRLDALHEDSRQANAGYIWDWQRLVRAEQSGSGEFDLRPQPIAPAPDLNGDGHPDLVLAARHQAWILALSGSDGSPLWLAARGSDVRFGDSEQPLRTAGVESAVWGSPEWIGDLDGDLIPDLLVTLVDLPPGTAEGGQPNVRPWVEAISGGDGGSLWRYEVPEELLQLPAEQEPPYPLCWFYGAASRAIESGFGMDGNVLGYRRRSSPPVCERRGAGALMPHPARLVGWAGVSAPIERSNGATERPAAETLNSMVVLMAGSHVIRLDPSTGRLLAPPKDVGVFAGQLAPLGDLDGDGVPELILLEQGNNSAAAGGQPGVPPTVHVAACSLVEPRVLWRRALEAWWPARPRWHVPPPDWPLVVDLDGDGCCEVLVPNGSSQTQGNPQGAPWGGLELLDGRTGQPRWQRRIRTMDQFVDRFVVGPDIDGDGIRDVFAAALWGFRSDLYVDAISGADGAPLFWLRQEQPAACDGSDGLLVAEIFWWSADREGTPLLAVATTDLHKFPCDFTVSCFSVRRRALTKQASKLGVLRLADCDGDGIDELLSFVGSVNGVSQDFGGELDCFRGSGGERWRMLGDAGEPVADLDGDGVRDLARDDGYGLFRAVSGDNGRTLWSIPVAELHFKPGQLQAAGGVATPDLNGDGTPDLLVHGRGIQTHAYPPLHALSGRDGRRLWSSAMRVRWVESTLQLSHADLDADGHSEIIWVAACDLGYDTDAGLYPQQNRLWLVVLDARNGHVRWKQPLSSTYGQSRPQSREYQVSEGQLPVTVGDLDGDGVRDLVIPAEASPSPLRMEWRAFSGRDGRLLWRRPLELSGRGLHILDGVPPAVVADLGEDRPRVVVLDHVDQQLPSGPKQHQLRVQALDAESGAVVWTRQLPVAHPAGTIRLDTRDRADRPRITLLRRSGSPPLLALNLWSMPEQVAVLDGQGRDVTRLDLQTQRGYHRGRFHFHACDADGDGNDEIVLFHDDALMVVRGDNLAEVLWRRPIGHLFSHQVSAILEPPAGGSPTLILQSPYGDNSVCGLDAATGQVQWACPGPSTRHGSSVEHIAAAVVLSSREQTSRPRVYYRYSHASVSLCALGSPSRPTSSAGWGGALAEDATPWWGSVAQTDALRAGSPANGRSAGSDRRSVPQDPRYLRQLPWVPASWTTREDLHAVLWMCFYSGTAIALPFVYLRALVRRRSWSLKLWLALPVVALIVVLGLTSDRPEPIFASWSRRLYTGLVFFPVLWFAYRLVELTVAGQRRAVRNRLLVWAALGGLLAVISLAGHWQSQGRLLEAGERFTFEFWYFSWLPGLYTTAWLFLLSGLAVGGYQFVILLQAQKNEKSPEDTA